MLTKPTAQVWWNFCSPMLFSFVYFLIHAAAFVSPSSPQCFLMSVSLCHISSYMTNKCICLQCGTSNGAELLWIKFGDKLRAFSFFLLDAMCVCLCSSLLHVVICAGILHEIPCRNCLKVDAALIRKNCIYLNIVGLILQSFLFPPPPLLEL